MSPRRKRRSRRWYQRLAPISWLLLLLLLLASVSVWIGTRFQPFREAGEHMPQVQVLNGSQVRGLAGRVAEFLRDQGLDVVSIGNADSDEYAQTLVLLRRGDMATAHRVALALGGGKALEQLDPTLLLDVTVILGADYQEPEGASPSEEAAQATR